MSKADLILEIGTEQAQESKRCWEEPFGDLMGVAVQGESQPEEMREEGTTKTREYAAFLTRFNLKPVVQPTEIKSKKDTISI